MAILFCGIVMSHYTHYNLSPVTQVGNFSVLCGFQMLYPFCADNDAANHENNVICLRVMRLHLPWPWYLFFPTQGVMNDLKKS